MLSPRVDTDLVQHSIEEWDLNAITAAHLFKKQSGMARWCLLEVTLSGIANDLGQLHLEVLPTEEYIPLQFRAAMLKGAERFQTRFLEHRSDSPSLNITVLRGCYHEVDSNSLSFELGMLFVLNACFLPVNPESNSIVDELIKKFEVRKQELEVIMRSKAERKANPNQNYDQRPASSKIRVKRTQPIDEGEIVKRRWKDNFQIYLVLLFFLFLGIYALFLVHFIVGLFLISASIVIGLMTLKT